MNTVKFAPEGLGGMRKIAKDSLNGFLFNFHDPEQLATLVWRIMYDPKIEENLSRVQSLRQAEDDGVDYENPISGREEDGKIAIRETSENDFVFAQESGLETDVLHPRSTEGYLLH